MAVRQSVAGATCQDRPSGTFLRWTCRHRGNEVACFALVRAFLHEVCAPICFDGLSLHENKDRHGGTFLLSVPWSMGRC